MRYCIVISYCTFASLSAAAQTQPALVADSYTQTQPEPRFEVTDEMRGDIFMARKMYREAVDRYGTIQPVTAPIHNKTGIAFQQLQQYNEAERAYKRAVKADPSFAQAVNNLGTVYYARKNYRKATSQYEKAIKLAPQNASFISNLGMAWFARKKYDRATDLLAQAMALDPEVIERRGTTGTTLQDRSIEERAKFHYYLAKTYAKDGRHDLVLLYMRKSLEEGFTEREKFIKDPEFAKLQQEPEFQELLKLEPRVL